MPQSISVKGIAVGVSLLFAAYFACNRVLTDLLPLAPLWVAVAIGAVWHCVVILFCVPLAAGYVAGRISGHDRELNGALTGASFALYALIMLFADENFHFVDANFYFDFGFLPTLFLGPIGGWWGAQISAGVNPLTRRLRGIEAAASAEGRRQQQARAQSGYKLMLLMDERTPMPFVTDVLKRFFGMEHKLAIAAMLHIHDHGRGVAGIYADHEAAAAKLAELTSFIAGAGQPLRCVVEAPTG